MPETYSNYVDGEWIESSTGDRIENRNPADTNDVIGFFQRSSREDAERAVDAAAAAHTNWSETPGPERGRILRETAELLEEQKAELTYELTREEGKTHDEAEPEVQRAVDIFYYYAEKARDYAGTMKPASGKRRSVHTVKEPVGVAALITPWNYPIAIPAWKLAPALATGNTVVFKPASQAPNVARMLVESLDAAGIPDGVVNLVTGPGSEVGESFLTNGQIDAVSFTGSTKVGNMVFDFASEDQKRVQTEMGGKNPTLVMSSAGLAEAVDIVGAGAFGVTGQACTATSRAIVHTDLYDEFVERIVSHAESLSVGDGSEDHDMGPHVSESELEGTLQYIELGKEEGARLAAGGNELIGEEYTGGHYVEPTVFVDVDPSMRIAKEEIFGPVLCVLCVEDFEEALEVANDSVYGLSASIVTDDLSEANRFVDEIDVGVAKVNEKTTGLELNVPFGGVKQSSSETYREQGEAGLDFFTLSKTVYTNY